MDFPSTKQLFDLRRRVTLNNSKLLSDDHINKEQDIDRLIVSLSDVKLKNNEELLFDELSALRNKSLESFRTPQSKEYLIKLFLLSWEIFSKFDEDHLYYIPPIYLESHQKLLRAVVKGLLLRERKIVYGSSMNTGHIVLGGIEGVGKTTLLKAFSISIAVLFDRIIPVSYVYSKSSDFIKRPSQLISELIQILSPTNSENDHQISNNQQLTNFADLKIDIVFLLDEFQSLFRDPLDKEHRESIKAVNEMAELSRLGSNFGIITGSSYNMQNYLFENKSHGDLDLWRKYGYANFNGTLYCFHNVPALRNVELLKGFLFIRYPRWILDDNQIEKLLIYTGGVGRVIHGIWCILIAETSFVIDDNKNNITTILSDDIMIEELNFRKKISPEKSLEGDDSKWFAVIVNILIETHNNEVIRPDGKIIGIEISFLKNILRTLGCNHPDLIITTAVDSHGLIYIDIESEVQFTYPYDYYIYNRLKTVSKKSILILVAVTMMIYGLSQEGNNSIESDITVNAGFALEALVRKNIAQCLINESFISDNSIKIKINSEGKLCLIKNEYFSSDNNNNNSNNNNNEEEEEELTEVSINQLNNKHLKWKSERGLDGVIFQRDDSNNKSIKPCWNIHGWQCKGGRYNIQINNGSLDKSMNQYEKKYLLSDVSDNNIQGIIIKASVGFCQLISALQKTLPNITFLPSSLTLTTTKRVKESKPMEFYLHKKIISHNKLNKNKLIINCKVNLVINKGVSWVIDCIDPDLKIIAKQMLHNSIDDSSLNIHDEVEDKRKIYNNNNNNNNNNNRKSCSMM